MAWQNAPCCWPMQPFRLSTDMEAAKQLFRPFAAYFPVSAHGVRPLWEVAKPAYVAPLGDSARMLRQEHMSAKKAEIGD